MRASVGNSVDHDNAVAHLVVQQLIGQSNNNHLCLQAGLNVLKIVQHRTNTHYQSNNQVVRHGSLIHRPSGLILADLLT